MERKNYLLDLERREHEIDEKHQAVADVSHRE
jgi:hypothetical protein